MTDRYALGAVVPLTWQVIDANGDLADAATVALTVTMPDGTTETPTVVHDDTGIYTTDYTPAAAGRYVARFVATGTNAGADEDVFDVTAPGLARVTLEAVLAYLGETSWSDADIQDALDAETLAQAARCRIDPYPADLAQALKRRVRRNLEARGVALSSTTSFDEGANVTKRVPWIDPEIRRFEGPYRRRCVG